MNKEQLKQIEKDLNSIGLFMAPHPDNQDENDEMRLYCNLLISCIVRLHGVIHDKFIDNSTDKPSMLLLDKITEVIADTIKRHRTINWIDEDGSHSAMVDILSHGTTIKGGLEEVENLLDTIVLDLCNSGIFTDNQPVSVNDPCIECKFSRLQKNSAKWFCKLSGIEIEEVSNRTCEMFSKLVEPQPGDPILKESLSVGNEPVSLKTINDDFVGEMPVTGCCGYGPITDENYCPMCGIKIKKEEQK